MSSSFVPSPITAVGLTGRPDEANITKTLLAKLKGKEVFIPNLVGIFVGWPHETNIHYLRLKEEAEGRLDDMLDLESILETVREADPALIVSMFWPDATYPTLRILYSLVIWQGVFDDMVEMFNNIAGLNSEQLRSDMKMFISNALGVSLCPDLNEHFKVLSIAKAFEAVADGIRSEYDKEQRRRFRDYLYQYIDATAEEKAMVDAGHTPQWLEYWELRGRVGGVGPLIGMIEFAVGSRLPREFFESVEFETACRSLNIVVGLTNDLVSVKKEINSGRVFSAIPILFNGIAGESIDIAVAHVLVRIKEAATSLSQALDALTVRYSAEEVDPEMARAAARVIRNVKHIMTGNFFWSLRCERYGMAQHLSKDGSLRFTLE